MRRLRIWISVLAVVLLAHSQWGIIKLAKAGPLTTTTYSAPLVRAVSSTGPAGTPVTHIEMLTLRGAVQSATAADGTVLVQATYDAFGRLVTLQQEKGGVESRTYGPFSALRSRSVGAMASSPVEQESSTFDDRGRALAIFAGPHQTQRFGYDLLGRVAREVRPSTGFAGEESFYDTTYFGASSKVLSVTGPDRVLQFHYDAPRSLLSRIDATALSTQGLIGGAQQSLSFDDLTYLGLPRTVTLRAGDRTQSTVVSTFDGAGRVRREVTQLARDGGALEAGDAVSTEYQLGLGRSHLSVGADGFSYERDAANRVRTVRRDVDGLALAQFTWLGGSGPASGIAWGNGVAQSRSFDARGRTTDESLGSALSLAYGYGTDGLLRGTAVAGNGQRDATLLMTDEAGRISAEMPNFSGDVSSLLQAPISNAALQPFVKASGDSRQYALDASNNWTAVTSGSDTLLTQPDGANAYQRLPEGAATYDRAGRIRSAGNKVFGYDVWGNLASVSDGSTDCQYRYDALGRRAEQSCGAGSVRFSYDGQQLVSETTGGKRSVTVPLDGLNEVLARVTDGNVAYLIRSLDGSVRAALGASGKVLERYRYTAFGETTIDPLGGERTGNRFAFQGQAYDEGTGLYDMHARTYAPRWGRFLTPDPAGVAGGANLYAFVRNRPHVFGDPLGLSPNPSSDPTGGSGGFPNSSMPWAGARGGPPSTPTTPDAINPLGGAEGWWNSLSPEQQARALNATSETIHILTILKSGGFQARDEAEGNAWASVFRAMRKGAPGSPEALSEPAARASSKNTPPPGPPAPATSTPAPVPRSDAERVAEALGPRFRAPDGAIRVTEKGIARIEGHLGQLDALHEPANAAMLGRLRAGETSAQDTNFYMHELKESAVMARTGGYGTYEGARAAHMETLQWQGIPYAAGYESQLYHPSVIRSFPEMFNPAAWPK